MDVWIANEPSLEQTMPLKATGEKALDEDPFLIDSEFKIIPYVLEGSVESFDPVARAKELAKTMPRRWCGTFRFFDDELDHDVKLLFSKVTPKGQIISLSGEMRIGNIQTPINGYLNAKSDQLELIPLADILLPGMKPGGIFMGLQGSQIFGWKATSLQNLGGKLLIQEECDGKVSKPPAVRTIW